VIRQEVVAQGMVLKALRYSTKRVCAQSIHAMHFEVLFAFCPVQLTREQLSQLRLCKATSRKMLGRLCTFKRVPPPATCAHSPASSNGCNA
jgi:hypothetical protein